MARSAKAERATGNRSWTSHSWARSGATEKAWGTDGTPAVGSKTPRWSRICVPNWPPLALAAIPFPPTNAVVAATRTAAVIASTARVRTGRAYVSPGCRGLSLR